MSPKLTRYFVVAIAVVLSAPILAVFTAQCWLAIALLSVGFALAVIPIARSLNHRSNEALKAVRDVSRKLTVIEGMIRR